MSEQILRPGRMNEKVAFVTGAAGNIGTAITRRLLEEGARVVMTGRNTTKLEEARARLLAEVGAAGQARLERTVATVGGEGLSSRVCARYLESAGVRVLYVTEPGETASPTSASPSPSLLPCGR